MVIVIRRDLQMRKGKSAAQSSHAASLWMLREFDPESLALELRVPLTSLQREWLDPRKGNMAKIVVGCDSEAELDQLVASAEAVGIAAHKVTDEGRTEFHGVPTVTCAAFGPDYPEKLDAITGHLKLM